MSGTCFSCQKTVEVLDRVGRQEDCPHCGTPLHCCRNCQFYDPSAYNECHEPVADRVLKKEAANFCDYYKWSGGLKKAGLDEAGEAKKKLEGLFKKG